MRSQGTRERLESAAMTIFAEHGFADVSTRDIGRAAGVVLSAIAYHYGTKNDLYVASAERAAKIMAAPVEAMLARPIPELREECRANLVALVETVAGVMLAQEPDARAATQFGLRELAVGGPAASVFKQRVLLPVLHRASELLRRSDCGVADESIVMARSLALFGPITLYRLSLGKYAETDDADHQRAVKAAISSVTQQIIASLSS